MTINKISKIDKANYAYNCLVYLGGDSLKLARYIARALIFCNMINSSYDKNIGDKRDFFLALELGDDIFKIAKSILYKNTNKKSQKTQHILNRKNLEKTTTFALNLTTTLSYWLPKQQYFLSASLVFWQALNILQVIDSKIKFKNTKNKKEHNDAWYKMIYRISDCVLTSLEICRVTKVFAKGVFSVNKHLFWSWTALGITSSLYTMNKEKEYAQGKHYFIAKPISEFCIAFQHFARGITDVVYGFIKAPIDVTQYFAINKTTQKEKEL